MEFVIGDTVAAYERKGKGSYQFSDGGFGGKYRPFLFHDKDGDGLCAGRGLGEFPNLEMNYFQ